MWIKSAGNSLTNIHPLYYSDYTDYENSCGFLDECGNNTYNYCYSDQHCIAFYNKKGSNVYTDCFAYWYSSNGGREIAFKCDKWFNSQVSGANIGFREDTENDLLIQGGLGKGCLDRVLFDAERCGGYWTYEWYITGSPLYQLKCFYFSIKRFFEMIFK